MIRHLIRQERSGGFWLIRDEGRAIELSPAVFRYLAALHHSETLLAQETQGAMERALIAAGGGPALDLLRLHGLNSAGPWGHVRWVTAGKRPGDLPHDAVAAPKRIYFELTRRCNLGCRSCFNESGRPLQQELTLDEVLDINRQAWELGVFELRYTGGECTTLPWFPEVIADAQRLGFYISIGTNGVYSDATLQWLLDSGIDWFIVSLDGGREVNDRIRGKGAFDKVMHTLTALATASEARVRLNMVVGRHNLDRVEAVTRIAHEHGVQSLNLIPLRPYGRSLRQMVPEMLDQQDFYAFIREVNRLRLDYPQVSLSTTIDLLDPADSPSRDPIVQKKTSCAAGVEACVVGPTGDVYGCSYGPASFPDSDDEEGRRLFVAGNLRRDDLRTIWRDSERWGVFRDLERFKNPKCMDCGYYTKRCSGSCPIMAWFELQHRAGVSSREDAIGRVCDPYCFVDLLPDQPIAQPPAPRAGEP